VVLVNAVVLLFPFSFLTWLLPFARPGPLPAVPQDGISLFLKKSRPPRVFPNYLLPPLLLARAGDCSRRCSGLLVCPPVPAPKALIAGLLGRPSKEETFELFGTDPSVWYSPGFLFSSFFFQFPLFPSHPSRGTTSTLLVGTFTDFRTLLAVVSCRQFFPPAMRG